MVQFKNLRYEKVQVEVTVEYLICFELFDIDLEENTSF